MFSMACVLYELLTGQPAFMRPEDESGVELTYEELRQVALLRQAQWVSSHAATCSVQGQALTLNFLLLCLVHAGLDPYVQCCTAENESAC